MTKPNCEETGVAAPVERVVRLSSEEQRMADIVQANKEAFEHHESDVRVATQGVDKTIRVALYRMGKIICEWTIPGKYCDYLERRCRPEYQPLAETHLTQE